MDEPPRHILHVTQSTDGGISTYLRSLAADQIQRGWRVTLVCPPQGPLPDLARGVRGISLLAWDATRNPGPSVVSEVRSLRGLTRAVSPDLIHLHSSKAGLVGRLAAGQGTTPLVYQPHAWSFEAVTGLVRRVSITWERIGARLCEQVICVSEAERQRALLEGVVGPMRVIMSGIDVDRLRSERNVDRRQARESLGLPEVPLAVCVGRLCEQKGQDVLLEAWRAVLRQAPEACLALVGDGELRSRLRYMRVPNVIFAGTREDVPRWLRAADLVVAPSRWEGFSLAIIEAMALGRTVVATDVDGVREALGDTIGYVVPPDDPRGLVSPIVDRLLNADLAAREGRRATRRVERYFDIRRTHEEIARLYDDLLGVKAPVPVPLALELGVA
jgi:glycosyltransferase involved in cell wall biosynthesis